MSVCHTKDGLSFSRSLFFLIYTTQVGWEMGLPETCKVETKVESKSIANSLYYKEIYFLNF